MATSGSFETSAVEGRSLIFSWNRTSTDIANNTSTIAWSVKGGGSYTGGWVTCGDIDVVINGTTVYNSSAESRINVWLGTVVASGTATISHNADGSKSFSASVAGAVYSYAQNVSRNYTWTLDSIPRASNIDKVAQTDGAGINAYTTGNDIRVYFTPKSTAFKYRITVSMNGRSAQNNALGVSVSSLAQQYYQVNIPHSWLPDRVSDTLVCKLETLNGTAVIGTHNINISMSVPPSIVPSLGTPTSTPVNSNTVISSWGIYVAGYSKARLVCTASGSNGSTISKFQIAGDISATINGASLSYDINLSYGGVKTFTVSAIDSRGRATAAKTISINVQTYSMPNIQSFNVVRSDANGNISESGTNSKLSFVGYYSNIGNNAMTATFAYKLSTTSTFTNLNNTATGSGGTINGSIVLNTIAFAAASEYDFKVTMTDSLGNSVTRTVRLGSASRTLNVAKYGNGVAFGKMSTVTTSGASGKLECAWDADFDKDVNIDGKLALGGGLSSALPIKDGGTGATTSEGIAQSHYHTYISNAGDGGQESGYLKIATIQISGPYMNQGIEIDFIRRGDQYVTTAAVIFHGTDNNDPNLDRFNTYGPATAWLYKTAAGTWDLYTQKSGWDSISILNIRKGANNWGITVTPTNVYAASLPSGTTASVIQDFVLFQGDMGAWSVRQWNSGVAECWRTISGTITKYATWNNMHGYQGTASFPPGLFNANPNVQYQVYIGSGFAMPARGAASTKDTFNWLALASDSTSNVGYAIDVYAIGTWK